MPQVDLETLVSVCAGGGPDRKIACETLADPDGDGEHWRKDDDVEVVDLPPDLPPESFWLSKDAEFDWFDRNAFLDRKDSTKRNSNSMNPNAGLNPASNSSSQRFSKSKAALIGLPKTQKTSYVDTTKYKSCNKPANIRLFPKRPESVGKAVVAEPSSPKVSCMGRVRSKRGRRKLSEPAPAPAPAKPAKMERSVDRRRTGIYGRLMGIFRSRQRRKQSVQACPPPPKVDSPPRRSVTVKSRGMETGAPVAAEPPGLGGMMRFASGRRSTSLVADADLISDTDVSSMKC